MRTPMSSKDHVAWRSPSVVVLSSLLLRWNKLSVTHHKSQRPAPCILASCA